MKILLVIFLLFSISCVKDRTSLIEESETSQSLANKKSIKKRVDSHIDLAINSLKNQNYPIAYEQLFKAKKVDPKNARIYNILGLVYLYDDKHDLAVKNLKKAISLKKNYSEAHVHLGITYGELEKYDLAIKEFKKAVSNIFYKTPWKAYTNLGRTYFLMKDYKNAIKIFNKSLSKNSYQCIPYELLGEIYGDIENIEEAKYNYKESLKYCKGQSLIHKKLGMLFLKEKKEQEALKEFELCLENITQKQRLLSKECDRYIKLIR